MEISVTADGGSVRPMGTRFLFPTQRDSEFEIMSQEKILLIQPIGSISSSPTVVLNWEAELINKKNEQGRP